jgi:hypothetical protein
MNEDIIDYVGNYCLPTNHHQYIPVAKDNYELLEAELHGSWPLIYMLNSTKFRTNCVRVRNSPTQPTHVLSEMI